jgi:hypothetical protein
MTEELQEQLQAVLKKRNLLAAFHQPAGQAAFPILGGIPGADGSVVAIITGGATAETKDRQPRKEQEKQAHG